MSPSDWACLGLLAGLMSLVCVLVKTFVHWCDDNAEEDDDLDC